MQIHFTDLFIPYNELMSNFLEPLKYKPKSECFNELNNLSAFLLLGIHRFSDKNNGKELPILSFDISQSIDVSIQDIHNEIKKLTELGLISSAIPQASIQGSEIIEVRPTHNFFAYQDFEDFLKDNDFTIIE